MPVRVRLLDLIDHGTIPPIGGGAATLTATTSAIPDDTSQLEPMAQGVSVCIA